ncbi:CvpA family protein [Lentilactobacillus sp. SPB1-3]|uniref:CvpA family protein n=1 Tax=Lentilactobacillus terminaliae TaxID=3003483 RepID=A0ACD5DCQ6_9LACO|nr:CvpA family protein [Lentilactobacillus sp. SPB1-3]MCZ0977360.1 CvpA family protein [Lentilactobacillus sp. SPB1-3]
MILDLIIVAILVLSFTAGYRRGFVAEFLNLVGFIFALALAWRYTANVSDWIVNQFNLTDQHRLVYWISFLIIYTLVWRVIMLLKRVISPATRIVVLKQVNAIFGGVIRLLVAYLFVFAGLNLLLLFSEPVKEQYQESYVAKYIVRSAPQQIDHVVDNA